MSEKDKKAAAAEDNFDYSAGMMDAAPKQNKCETYLRLPAGVTLFNGKEDVCYRLLFFPWKAGKGNPAATQGVGTPVINRFLFVHQNVGSDNESHLCPQKTMGQVCPICKAKADYLAANKGKKWDELKKQAAPLSFKNREIWLLHELEGKPDNLQIWEESCYLFGDHLRKWINAKTQYRSFAHPKNGMVVEVTGTEKQFPGGGAYIEWGMIQFQPRTEADQPSEKLLAKLAKLCPDDWIRPTQADKLKKLFFMTGEEHEDDETETPVDEEEKETPEDDEQEEETPPPVPAPKKKKPAPAPAPEPEDSDSEDEEEEDETPAPTPPPKKKKPAPAPEPEEEEESEEASESEEEEESEDEIEDEEVEEEEEPAPKPTKKPGKKN